MEVGKKGFAFGFGHCKGHARKSTPESYWLRRMIRM